MKEKALVRIEDSATKLRRYRPAPALLRSPAIAETMQRTRRLLTGDVIGAGIVFPDPTTPSCVLRIGVTMQSFAERPTPYLRRSREPTFESGCPIQSTRRNDSKLPTQFKPRIRRMTASFPCESEAATRAPPPRLRIPPKARRVGAPGWHPRCPGSDGRPRGCGRRLAIRNRCLLPFHARTCALSGSSRPLPGESSRPRQ